jgi:tRNA threonylcarbamoyladenosine biosynthesis protein TsaB
MRWLNLGAADRSAPIGAEAINADRSQSELLPGAVENFLSRRGYALRDLGLIAVTTGPGYYTGIRVGLSYASALAESIGIPLAPVCTLRALAHSALQAGFTAAPVLRASGDAIYCAVYRDGGELIPPMFCPPGDLVREAVQLTRDGSDVVVVGSDALLFRELEISHLRIMPTSPAIGLDLAVMAADIPPADPTSVRASYLRAPG